MGTEKVKVLRVVSGGQTGADQGGLEGAKRAGVRTGGYAPRGWVTEKGAAKRLLESFGLEEWPIPGYPARTEANVVGSDGTVLFTPAPDLRGGSRLTRTLARKHGRPLLHLYRPIEGSRRDMVKTLAKWIVRERIEVLNVAGSRESGAPGIQDEVAWIVERAIREVNGD